MAIKNVFLFLVLIPCLVAFASATRSYGVDVNTPGSNLEEWTENASAGQIIECWKSLLKLNSCSLATIQYFFTGQTDLSSECCSAIEISKSACSPSGLTTLGFTAQEGNILSAYCASLAPAPAPSS